MLLYEDNNLLIGQKNAADAIDRYVNDKIFNLEVELENLNEAAYMGVIYYEAVQMLRDGQFSVLNEKAIANTIDDYVRSKFARFVTHKMEVTKDAE